MKPCAPTAIGRNVLCALLEQLLPVGSSAESAVEVADVIIALMAAKIAGLEWTWPSLATLQRTLEETQRLDRQTVEEDLRVALRRYGIDRLFEKLTTGAERHSVVAQWLIRRGNKLARSIVSHAARGSPGWRRQASQSIHGAEGAELSPAADMYAYETYRMTVRAERDSESADHEQRRREIRSVYGGVKVARKSRNPDRAFQAIKGPFSVLLDRSVGERRISARTRSEALWKFGLAASWLQPMAWVLSLISPATDDVGKLLGITGRRVEDLAEGFWQLGCDGRSPGGS